MPKCFFFVLVLYTVSLSLPLSPFSRTTSAAICMLSLKHLTTIYTVLRTYVHNNTSNRQSQKTLFTCNKKRSESGDILLKTTKKD